MAELTLREITSRALGRNDKERATARRVIAAGGVLGAISLTLGFNAMFEDVAEGARLVVAADERCLDLIDTHGRIVDTRAVGLSAVEDCGVATDIGRLSGTRLMEGTIQLPSEATVEADLSQQRDAADTSLVSTALFTVPMGGLIGGMVGFMSIETIRRQRQERLSDI
jgi:hypothetical protein